MRLIDLDKLEPFAPDYWYKGRELLTLPVVYQPSNDPLTLEELREMDGEPVWVRDLRSGDYMCRVIASTDKHFTSFTDGMKENRSYGSYWLAYRSRPEEGTI